MVQNRYNNPGTDVIPATELFLSWDKDQSEYQPLSQTNRKNKIDKVASITIIFQIFFKK